MSYYYGYGSSLEDWRAYRRHQKYYENTYDRNSPIEQYKRERSRINIMIPGLENSIWDLDPNPKEYRAKKAKLRLLTKPPKPTKCIECELPEIFCKLMCKRCYSHNWRLKNPEKALAGDKRHREKEKTSGYRQEYAHKPSVVNRRNKRAAIRRQTPEHKEYQAFFKTLRYEINRIDLPESNIPIHNLNILVEKDKPIVIGIKEFKEQKLVTATKYNRSGKGNQSQARYRAKPGIPAQRAEKRRSWGEITEYNAKEREGHYYTTRQAWGWARKSEFLGYQEGEAGEFDAV